MSGIMHRELLVLVWMVDFEILSLQTLMTAYIKKQLITSIAIFFGFFIWSLSLVLKFFEFKKWSQIRRAVKWNPYFKAVVLISNAYATLLLINARYISVVIIPIIVLAFIGALYFVVTPNSISKSDEDNHNEGNKPDDVGGTGTASNSVDNDYGLFVIAILPCWVLRCMGHFSVDNLVVSQFLLFLTATLAELALMMAKLPSKEVGTSFQIIRRASHVVALVTAHTMAAELLGTDEVLLACTPELLTGLVWFTIHFGYLGSCSAKVSLESWQSYAIAIVSSHSAGIALVSMVMAITAWVAMDISSPSLDGSAEAVMDLLSKFTSVMVACSFSVILPSLCVFVLCQWPAKATEAPSSELHGAIKLFSFCRNMMFIAAIVYLVLTPVLDVRLRLQAQRIFGSIVNKVVNRSVTRYSSDSVFSSCPC